MPIVNPERLTKFDRTEDELFRLLFFSVAVAGKTAKQVAIKVNAFFDGQKDARLYLHTLFVEKRLRSALEAQRMGKYNVLEGFVDDILAVPVNLSTCSVEELETYTGVGPKTARMFLLHSRPDQRFAVLDTHVLKFLRYVHPDLNVPKATPSGRKYAELERAFLNYMDFLKLHNIAVQEIPGKGSIEVKYLPDGRVDVAAFDLDLWRLYSGNKDDYA